jgi:uncharacterized protein involved in exopolysaccharide biosynthesis
MKNLLQWLVRLYPRPWLERYEAEFRVLLDDIDPKWSDLLDMMKEGTTMRLRTGLTATVLAFGVIAAAIAALVLSLTPRPYESHAIVTIRSTYFRDYPVPDQMRTLAQRVTSRDFLRRVINEFNLYPNLRSSGETERVIEKVRKGIRISSQFPEPARAVTQVSFDYSDPQLAKSMTDALLTRLIDENIRLQESERVTHGDTFEKAALWSTAELISTSSIGQRPLGPRPTFVIALALVEGSQLGLIFALLRRRSSSPGQSTSALCI